MHKNADDQPQKIEYTVVTIRSKPAPINYSNGVGTVTVSTYQSSIDYASNVANQLKYYSEKGWVLKEIVDVDGNTFMILERPHPEYKGYNNELADYLIEKK